MLKMTYLRPFFRRFSLISPFIIGLKRCGQRHSKALDVLFPLVPKKYRKNNFFIGQNHQNTKRGFLWITLYIYINALNVRINRGVSSEQDFYMYVLFFMGGGRARGHKGLKVNNLEEAGRMHVPDDHPWAYAWPASIPKPHQNWSK